MIHVCFALHDKTGHYSKFTGTTMLSIFANTKAQVTVHILHDNTLTQDNREKFSLTAEQYNQRVNFYNVDELCAEEIKQLYIDLPQIATVRHTIAMFYRFFVGKLISADVEKMIYLDSDIVVNLDIAELWQIELGEKIFGVIPEIANYKSPARILEIHPTCRDGIVKVEDCFNSGVLLMNLNAFRNERETLSAGIKFIGKNLQYVYLDQDILNYCFSTRTLKLPVKFNRFAAKECLGKNFTIEKNIYHYLSKNLRLDMSDPFNQLWMNYFAKTPWFNEKTIGSLYRVFQQVHIAMKNTMIKLSAAMSGKARAFVVLKSDVDTIKKLFFVRDDEEVIIVERDTPRHELFEKMTASRDKKFFLIFAPNFPYINFAKLGFVYGKDFLSGAEFLSEAQGVPLDSWPLIQAM